jgi:hypothetical protein
MNNCNICGTRLAEPIFTSDSETALTSLCELRPGQVRVWSCSHCGHLLGDAMPDTEQYYETDYRILLDHDDEDQIYETHGDEIVYRTAHQVTTLLEKLDLPQGASLLDYGCAKASTPKQLLSSRSDLRVHLFDVSEMYSPFWDQFVSVERRAVHHAPAHWHNKFDVVTSFFALEHIPSPKETVAHIAGLLSDDGVFYGIVPDTFGNVADFIVIDHVNHFTASSLHLLLVSAGFKDIDIDAGVHRGALVFTAKKSGEITAAEDARSGIERARALADYWAGIGQRIRSFEQSDSGKSAIYGSGFYGAYIFSVLRHPERVRCFLDRSPFQQGKALFDRPIRAPDQLPGEVSVLYVGLNPSIARETMGKLAWPENPALHLVFLDGEAT